MGLLQKIQTQDKPQEKKALGLILQAEKYTFAKQNLKKESFVKKTKVSQSLFIDESHVYFSDFSQTMDFQFSGILKQNGNSYNLIYAYKIENENLFLSSKDFWKGLLVNNEWNYFEKESLAPLYQFFSLSLEDDLQLAFKFFNTENNSFIFFSAQNKNQDQKTALNNNQKLNDFMQIIDTLFHYYNNFSIKHFDNKQNMQLGLKDYGKALCIKLENPLLQENKMISKTGLNIIKNISQIICNNFLPEPSFAILSEDFLKIILFTNQEIEADLFLAILKKHFEDFLHSSTIAAFSLQNLTKAKDIIEIEAFLSTE